MWVAIWCSWSSHSIPVAITCGNGSHFPWATFWCCVETHWAYCCPLLLDEGLGDTRPGLPSALELESCEMPAVPTGVADEGGIGLPAALGIGQGIKFPDLVFIGLLLFMPYSP